MHATIYVFFPLSPDFYRIMSLHWVEGQSKHIWNELQKLGENTHSFYFSKTIFWPEADLGKVAFLDCSVQNPTPSVEKVCWDPKYQEEIPHSKVNVTLTVEVGVKRKRGWKEKVTLQRVFCLKLYASPVITDGQYNTKADALSLRKHLLLA